MKVYMITDSVDQISLTEEEIEILLDRPGDCLVEVLTDADDPVYSAGKVQCAVDAMHIQIQKGILIPGTPVECDVVMDMVNGSTWYARSRDGMMNGDITRRELCRIDHVLKRLENKINSLPQIETCTFPRY